ncbi:hypothetical protein [Paraburkholderia tropica]|uniref:hypothetical protein n=1 Tax=Paraburkholderia tropica TaxID=92647 RepID=UPI002AB6D3D2|nr:hypothetical protein [Paraburkholderia tropica]
MRDHVRFSEVGAAGGRSIDLAAIRPGDVDVFDIAHGLSRKVRISGRTRAFYSVADHSIRVASHLPAPLRLAGLLYDASRAYIDGLSEPFASRGCGGGEIRERVCSAIAERFGLPAVLPAAVYFADRVIYATALRDIAIQTPSSLEGYAAEGVVPLEETIHPLTGGEAQVIFLQLFERYAGRTSTGGIYEPGRMQRSG